jgi:hypothetical protein
MADITLAELNGAVWLIDGERFIDDLLANTLPDDISIEMVACESQEAVQALWEQHCGAPEPGSLPWAINPALINRIRNRSPDFAVFFAQWSALLDDDAMTVVNAAASWAHDNPEMPVQLAEFIDPAGPASIADLARLRATLIEEALIKSGIDHARIGRVRRDVAEIPGMPQESQRIDIIVRPG